MRLLLLTVRYDLAMSSHGLYSYLVLLISIPAVEENPRGKERFKALLLVWCFQKWKPRGPARGRLTHMLLANMWSGAPPPLQCWCELYPPQCCRERNTECARVCMLEGAAPVAWEPSKGAASMSRASTTRSGIGAAT